MALYGWDTSHYDGLLSTAVLARAKGEGITFFTAKVGEGTSYDDPNDRTALAAAREAGIEFIGGYFVVRTGGITNQVDACLHLADRDEPWWRTFPGWFWQVDLERWPSDSVSAATGINFAQQLRARSDRQVILYASRGQYGDQLSAWNGPLWNAHYASSRLAPFRDLYPGDNFTGWARYSGQVPAILQYASSATIAGLSTCDANAFRGTVEDLRALIGGGQSMATLTTDDPGWLDTLFRVDSMLRMQDPASRTKEPNELARVIRAIATDAAAAREAALDAKNVGEDNKATAAALEARLDAVEAKLDALLARPPLDLTPEQLGQFARVLLAALPSMWEAVLDRTRLTVTDPPA